MSHKDVKQEQEMVKLAFVPRDVGLVAVPKIRNGCRDKEVHFLTCERGGYLRHHLVEGLIIFVLLFKRNFEKKSCLVLL